MSTRSQLTKDLNGKWKKGKWCLHTRERLGVAIMCRFFFYVMTQHQTTHLRYILTGNLNVSLNQRRYA